MLKKTLSIILAIAMLCSMIPVVALADDEIIGGADGATDIVVENNEENEAVEEEPAVEPAATHDFDTSNLEDIGVPMPATLANVRYTNAEDKAQVASTADLPDSSELTYVLIDSSDAEKSNFEAVLPEGGSWQNTVANMGNVWLSGVSTRRSTSSLMSNASTHTAYIVVPESVGKAGKEFQVVTMNIRTPDRNNPPTRYKADATRAIQAWVDDQPVAVNVSTGHDALGNMRQSYTDDKKGLGDNLGRWSSTGGGSYFIWEWGPTVTLTPGVHKIVYKPAGASSGGRTPGLILTSALGYDWTKISPFPASSYTFSDAIGNIQADFAASFGAAGYIDFAGPVFADNAAAEANAQAFGAELSWPAATKTGVYGDDKVAYYVECGDKGQYVTGTSATISGLVRDTEYTAKIYPIDAVGNKGTALEVPFRTLSEVGFPYFATEELKVNLGKKPSEEARTTTLPLTWAAADNTAEKAVTYAVYVNDEKKASGITATNYTVKDLTPGTEYNVKVVIEADGTELSEAMTSVSGKFYTGLAATAEVANVTTSSAQITLSNIFANEADYNVTYSVIANGSDANFTQNGKVITLSNLVDDLTYNVYVTATAVNKTTKETISVVYGPIPFKTEVASSEATYAPGSVLMWKGTANSWIVDASNTKQNEEWFDPATEIWYACSANSPATYSADIPEDGNYYVATRTYTYELTADRSFTATINGQTVKHNGSPFQFGFTNCTAKTSVISYCPTPVTLSKGKADIALTAASGSVLRVEFVLLIPANSTSAVESVISGLTSKEDVLAMNDAATYITNSSITTTILGTDQILVNWLPNAAAKGDEDVKYEVYLNDTLVKTMNWNDRKLTLSEGVIAGKNVIKVVAVSNGVNKGTATANVTINTAVPATATTTIVDVVNESGKVTGHLLKDVSVSFENKTPIVKKMVAMVAVFQNNRVIEMSPVNEIDLLPGESAAFDYTLLTSAEAVAQTTVLDPNKAQAKIFLMDATNGYAPVLMNYNVE